VIVIKPGERVPVDGIIIDSTNIGANSYDNEISILSDSNADWDSYLRPSDQDTRYWRINTTLICGNDKYYLEYWWEPSENGNSTKCTIECIQKGSSYNWESYFVSVDNNKTRIVSPFFDDNILNNLNEGQSITFSTNIPLGLAIGNYRFYITANDKEVYSKDFIAKPRNINFDEDLRPYHTNFYFKQSLIKEGDILTVEGYLISGLIESKSTINGLITVILNNNISKTVKIEFTNYQYAYVNVNFENLAPGNYSITKVIFNESDCYWYYYEGIPFSNNVSVVLDRSECYVSANGVDDWKTGGTKDHPFATLDYALDYVNENGKIILIGENSLQNFAINKSVTLVGIDNAVFRGDNSYRFFNISASNVTFSNLTFINGKVNNEGYGGALYFGANASNSAVIGCTFINSSAYNGGAIYLYNATGATIKDCNFINSTAKYSNNGYGGAICLDFGTGVNITNCSFINSFAGYYGGAIYYYEINDCNVIDCNFINSSSKAGGAIYCSNSINNSNVINCNFTNCNTTLQGGAIYCGGINGSVIGCTFINSSSEDGGAITWASSDGHVMGCSFINCSASDGGVISIYANLVLNYNIFDNNSPINGSVIYSKYNNTNCDYNFFALENNITELPDNLVTGTTVDNWVILKINALNGNYYVNFVSNDNNTLEEFMPDYTALLNINGAV
ncbi:MAG: hypothetical protein Q4P14_00005, partial [Methanobacteriaceae archaeon]|nr:hypothetical protein [Methanobacteriaceae archaeon]